MFTEHVASRSPRCAFEGAEAPCVLVDPLERDRVVVLEVLDLLEELAREGRQVGGQLVALALQRGAALAQLRLSLSLSLSLSLVNTVAPFDWSFHYHPCAFSQLLQRRGLREKNDEL